MNITVYLGSNEGKLPGLKDAVRQLGRWIGESGHALVYGGSKIGLMGILAESVVESGGQATGVEPQFFVDRVLQYDGLTELIVTENMSDRKAKMIEMGDAFIALPGGTGTLEEISEIMSTVSLGFMDVPCIVYDHDGYYQPLREMLQSMVDNGFSTAERLRNVHFAESIEQIQEILTPATASA